METSPEAALPSSGPGLDVTPVGWVRSALTSPTAAPRQADEGAGPADLAVLPGFRDALRGLRPGDEIHVLTWLHLADRRTVTVHPRDDPDRPLTGVFATRSADRPNPIGLHDATVVAVDGLTVRVDRLEAVDGTPVLDIKPRLAPASRR
jgi:tRNA-Thr(GGU) m(6)t(6)A37 methyltransferase TsaA